MLKAVEAANVSAAGDRLRARQLARGLVLAMLFGLVLGGIFVGVWLGLERAWTEKTTLAAAILAGSGTLAGLAAAVAACSMAHWQAGWRFAVASLCLTLGTAAFASFGLFVHAVLNGSLPHDSLIHAAFFILTQAAGAAFSFAGWGAPLVLLPGLPAILAFAALLARLPR